MALIKCNECGQMISDKASNCPNCGAPVEKKLVEQASTTKVEKTADRQPQERHGSGKNVGIVLLSIALVVVIGAVLFLLQRGNDTTFNVTNDDVYTEEIVSYDTICVEEEIEEEIEEEVVETAPIDRADVVRNAYIGKIKEMKEQFTAKGEYNEWWCGYFLLDITHDGTPELWITTGTCEADKEFCVYTYGDKWLINLGKDYWGNSGFHAGNDYVILVNAHMGDAFWYKYTYSDGKLKYEQIYEETISADEDYREPKEKYIELTSWDDTAPIERMPVN